MAEFSQVDRRTTLKRVGTALGGSGVVGTVGSFGATAQREVGPNYDLLGFDWDTADGNVGGEGARAEIVVAGHTRATANPNRIGISWAANYPENPRTNIDRTSLGNPRIKFEMHNGENPQKSSFDWVTVYGQGTEDDQPSPLLGSAINGLWEGFVPVPAPSPLGLSRSPEDQLRYANAAATWEYSPSGGLGFKGADGTGTLRFEEFVGGAELELNLSTDSVGLVPGSYLFTVEFEIGVYNPGGRFVESWDRVDTLQCETKGAIDIPTSVGSSSGSSSGDGGSSSSDGFFEDSFGEGGLFGSSLF